MMCRIFSAIAAVVLTIVALSLCAPKAEAAPSTFPSCIKTSLGANQTRYWVDPGNLVDRPIQSVSIHGSDLHRRWDGIWVGTGPKANSAIKSYVYITFNHSRRDNFWTACLRPEPRIY